MFNSKVSKTNFVSDYKSKLNQTYNLDKISFSNKYSALLQKLAQAGDEFDSAEEKELTEKTSKILELLTAKISKIEDVNNQKIAQILEENNLAFDIPEDTIDID